ncbi:MAG: hypothetical protein M1832_006043 [Thelocarpon impressellum]|nr:MAG: hypothetical protein M1832_006043 [Thelocarpon impressellum]
MTFLTRPYEDTVLIVRGAWDTGRGVARSATSTNGPNSGTSTPSNVRPKKITLSAYKKRAAGPAAGGQDMANGVTSSHGLTKEEPKMAGTDAAARRVEKRYASGPPTGERALLTRYVDSALDSTIDPHTSTRPSTLHSRESQPPTKRARASSPPPKKNREAPKSSTLHRSTPKDRASPLPAKHASEARGSTPHGATTGLPPLLSPLPPMHGPEARGTTPQRTTGLQDEISLISHKRGTKRKNESSINSSSSAIKHASSRKSSSASEPSRTKDRASQPSSKAAGPSAKQGSQAPSARSTTARDASHPAEKKPRLMGSMDPAPSTTPSKTLQPSKNGARHISPSPGPGAPFRTERAESKKRSLVLKLKYGRTRRMDVKRILNLSAPPSRTTKLQEEAVAPRAGSTNKAKTLERDAGDPSTTKPVERQARHLGKAKPLEKPTANTPGRQREKAKGGEGPQGRDRPGGGESAGDRERTHERGGEKRARGGEDERSRDPPAKRQKAPESLDVSKKPRTPLQPPFKSPALSTPGREPGSQPRGAERANGSDKTKGRGRDVDAWRAEHKKYLALGRKIKHEAQEVLEPKAEGAAVEDDAKKEGAVLAIESVLCWMLAFAADDEAHRLSLVAAEVQNWRSLMPFWKFVEARCRGIWPLHGLCLQIGAVIHETIHVLDMDRLSKERPLETSAAGAEAAPPTPGKASPKTDFLRWKGELVKDARGLRQLWIQGLSELTVDGLQTSFPETWAKRSKAPEARREERLVPGEYPEAFYLPLSGISTPMETVAATKAVLAEWTTRQGVKWSPARLSGE